MRLSKRVEVNITSVAESQGMMFFGRRERISKENLM